MSADSMGPRLATVDDVRGMGLVIARRIGLMGKSLTTNKQISELEFKA